MPHCENLIEQKQGMAQTGPIPFLDLKAQFATVREEITDAVIRTLKSQRFILGPEVEAFEKEIAARNLSKAAVAFASGSDALLLALMALEVGQVMR